MFGMIAKMTAGLARLLGRHRNSESVPARLDDPIRACALERERERARFDEATHRVALLRRQLDQARREGRCNQGQLALLQHDLQQAARNAQGAFDAATRVQDELAVLESVKAGRAQVQRTPAIPRAALENLLRDVALAEAAAERYHVVALELGEAVYGTRDCDVDNLAILAVPQSAESAPRQAPHRKVRVGVAGAQPEPTF